MSDIRFEAPRDREPNQELPQTPPEPPGYLWHPIERPVDSLGPQLELVPPPPKPPKLIPNIGHALAFFGLVIVSFIGGALIAFLAILFILRPHNPGAIGPLMTKNVVYAISMQAAIYIVLWGLAALVFSLWWGFSFLKGIHWNFSTARRSLLLYAGLGVISGLAITIAGNFLPMPKAPPILEDLTKSPAGAWALLIFGVTLAPLTEELAFRGFLLPGLVNIFRWLQRRGAIGEPVVRFVGIPLSILLTSIPFALMHSAQVSNSWGPVLLIGCVSVIVCVVRLTTDSVAAGVVVHMCYNLTLFSGLLYQTDWFRHLDKLKT